MEAAIVSIGHEILTGHTVNTNANYIARELLSAGIRVRKIVTIEDEPDEIYKTIKSFLREYQIIISTGGLGPTKDDLTKEAIAKVFNATQVLDKALAKEITEKYRQLGYSRVPRGGHETGTRSPGSARVFKPRRKRPMPSF